jgi:hypothetical protein
MYQVVSCWPLTTEAQVKSHARPCGICSGESATGTGFLQVTQFALSSIIPLMCPTYRYPSILNTITLGTDCIAK